MIHVTSFGKVKNEWRDDLIQRTQKLIPLSWKEIPLKHSPSSRTAAILPEEKKFLSENPLFVLLDIGGKQMNSLEFAQWLFRESNRHLIIGPAAGFHSEFQTKAREKISLSPLTLTHSLAQTLLAECLYRSACMQKNHPFAK